MIVPKRQAHLLAAQGVIAGLDGFYIMLLGVVLSATWGFLSFVEQPSHYISMGAASLMFILVFAASQRRWTSMHHLSKMTATVVVATMSFAVIVAMYATGLVNQLALPPDLFERTKHLPWVQSEKELFRSWSQWALTLSMVAVVGSFSTLAIKPNTAIKWIAFMRALTIGAAVGGLVIISFLLGRTQALVLLVNP